MYFHFLTNLEFSCTVYSLEEFFHIPFYLVESQRSTSVLLVTEKELFQLQQERVSHQELILRMNKL